MSLEDFFAYEKSLAAATLVPLLESRGMDLTGRSVLEAGCGYGGVLAGLRERFALGETLGLDLDPEMVEAGRRRCPDGVTLETGDFLAMAGRKFDFIVMRDVLEHIVAVEAALAKAADMLAPEGTLYVTFAPFYSPFGGHQHNGSGLFSRVPWLQILPEPLFRRMLRLPGNSYKSSAGLVSDMDTVLRTRLTLARFRKAAAAAGLRTLFWARYAVRPDYRIKFGLPQVPFPAIPVLDELFCTGVEALLTRP